MSESNNGPIGLGGWLTFTTIGHGIGIVFGPMLLIMAAFGPDGQTGVMVFAGLFFTTPAVFYFKRHKAYPTIHNSINGIQILGNAIVFGGTQTPELAGQLIGSIIGTALFALYLYKSKRVANTFTETF